MALVGSSMLAPLVRRAAQAAGSVPELRGWLALGRQAARANPLASLTLLATGIYLGKNGWWTQAWFWVAVCAWIVNAALAVEVVRRSAEALTLAASRAGDGGMGAEIDRLRHSRSPEIAEGVMRANDIALLYVMLDKPELLQSLALLALANLATLAVTYVSAWRRRGARGVAIVTVAS